MGKKGKKLHGTVDKIIKPVVPSEPEKAQIDIKGADDLYREIRIENTLTDEHGEEAQSEEAALGNAFRNLMGELSFSGRFLFPTSTPAFAPSKAGVV